MCIIFAFSSQPYEMTMKTSNLIVQPIRSAVEENKSFKDEQEKKDYSKKLKTKLDRAVRKSAHITLFAVLAVFIYLLIRSNGTNKFDAVILTLFICALYAGFDEFHQHFVKGRTSQFIDVCVDEFGAVLGMFLIWCKSKLNI